MASPSTNKSRLSSIAQEGYSRSFTAGYKGRDSKKDRDRDRDGPGLQQLAVSSVRGSYESVSDRDLPDTPVHLRCGRACC